MLMDIPCKDCITLVMCKVRIIDSVIKFSGSIKCPLLRDYISGIKGVTEMNSVREVLGLPKVGRPGRGWAD